MYYYTYMLRCEDNSIYTGMTNNLEKSWDCPCHGSRFNFEGDILEGPATIPLKNMVQKRITG